MGKLRFVGWPRRVPGSGENAGRGLSGACCCWWPAAALEACFCGDVRGLSVTVKRDRLLPLARDLGVAAAQPVETAIGGRHSTAAASPGGLAGGGLLLLYGASVRRGRAAACWLSVALTEPLGGGCGVPPVPGVNARAVCTPGAN